MLVLSQIPSNFSCQITRKSGSSLAQYGFKKPNFFILNSPCSSRFSVRFSCSLPHPRIRCAVLGAGFAGLSVTWHLLQHSCKELHLSVDLYDDIGIGGGASGVAGGLLHPYSPKVKLLWHGADCWKESLKLLCIAENAEHFMGLNTEEKGSLCVTNPSIIRRRGILRPAVSLKNKSVMDVNAQNCLASCRIELINEDTAEDLLPGLYLPFGQAFYMPEAISIHSYCYLEALYLACKALVKDKSTQGAAHKELNFLKKSIDNLLEFAGAYDSVIICLGARTAFLPEFSGILPLRTCRGVVAHLQLADNIREDYPEHSPSILSDAWLAVQGPRSLQLGSTWEWSSTNCSRNVPSDEVSKALEELLPKASAVYPAINNWTLTGAVAGLRAMPPLTPNGSLPLLGCVDNFIGGSHTCKYWLFTGLGSRGLLYHAWLGKLLAEAVLSANEESIPSELVSWKQNIRF